jgi:uncharacterized protein YukJ
VLEREGGWIAATALIYPSGLGFRLGSGAVPLESYGVLKATIFDRRLATERSAHYQLLCGVGTTRYRVAINAQSDLSPSEIAHATIAPFAHPILERLEQLKEGWHKLKPREGLDYVRGNLCTPEQFHPLPLAKAGPDNDLNELLDRHLRRGARIYAFGEPWGPDDANDPFFGFEHGRGIHDVHQNQGNTRQFRRDDGVWQDGGVIAGSPGRWTAILLRFQTQSWRTDDGSGHASAGGPGAAAPR